MPPQFGISLYPPQAPALFTIHRFSVYQREQYDLLEPHKKKKNLNYQVCGEKSYEKIVVRIFLDDDKMVYKSFYYYLKGMDEELAFYLSLELIERLKGELKFRFDHVLKLK